MMGEIKFAFLTLVISVAVVAIMQVRVGPKTIEQRLHGFVQSAVVAGSLQAVADGAIGVGKRAQNWLVRPSPETKPVSPKRRGVTGENVLSEEPQSGQSRER
jgi:hypothetical protein